MLEHSWAYTILSRAVHFPNLTAASHHVGLSQSQLSRLVAQLEAHTGVPLLDRRVRRHTTWTKEARRLSEIYLSSERQFQRGLQQLQLDDQPRLLRFASLEGLLPVAVQILAKTAKQVPTLREIHLDILDLNDLEEKFLSGQIDVILSSREPRHAKSDLVHEVGYQVVAEESKPRSDWWILSNFEFQKKPRHKTQQPVFVSNSLAARRTWLDEVGGLGRFPSALLPKGRRGTNAVILVGTPSFSVHLWTQLVQSC